MFITKNTIFSKQPQKSYTAKKLDMSLLVGQFLQDVHLIKKKIMLIFTEEKIVLKNYVKS